MDFFIGINKDYLGFLSLIISFIAFVPYFYLIYQKKVKPHIATFFIWSLTSGGASLAMFLEGAGPGSWAMIFNFCVCLGIALLCSFYHGEKNIKLLDFICLALAVIGIILWGLTENVIYGIIILTTVDAIGYLPTIKKTYNKPFEESLTLFSVGTVGVTVTILAIEEYNLTTLLFPLTILVFNIILIATGLIQRLEHKKI